MPVHSPAGGSSRAALLDVRVGTDVPGPVGLTGLHQWHQVPGTGRARGVPVPGRVNYSSAGELESLPPASSVHSSIPGDGTTSRLTGRAGQRNGLLHEVEAM